MLGDVNRGPAIFTAKRDALEYSKDDQQGRSEHPRLGVGRQEANEEGRSAHQANGDEESAFTTEAVTHDPENQRAERSERETRSEQAERGDERGRRIQPSEEHLRDEGGEASEVKEVVPFEGNPSG